MAKDRLHRLPGEARLEIGIPQPEDRVPGRDGEKCHHAAVAELDSGEASKHFKRRVGAFGNLLPSKIIFKKYSA